MINYDGNAHVRVLFVKLNGSVLTFAARHVSARHMVCIVYVFFQNFNFWIFSCSYNVRRSKWGRNDLGGILIAPANLS